MKTLTKHNFPSALTRNVELSGVLFKPNLPVTDELHSARLAGIGLDRISHGCLQVFNHCHSQTRCLEPTTRLNKTLTSNFHRPIKNIYVERHPSEANPRIEHHPTKIIPCKCIIGVQPRDAHEIAHPL
jgi:hypothetical protein